jgi:hypothetical protein
MTPNELFEELAAIVTQVCKHPFRASPVTPEECAVISDRILLLLAKEKKPPKSVSLDLEDYQ